MTDDVIERRQPVRHWSAFEAAQAAKEGRYVIWSIEHQAWWRAGRLGYCKTLLLAGHYLKGDAERIVADANRGGTVHECMIPAAAVEHQVGGF